MDIGSQHRTTEIWVIISIRLYTIITNFLSLEKSLEINRAKSILESSMKRIVKRFETELLWDIWNTVIPNKNKISEEDLKYIKNQSRWYLPIS